VLGFISGRRGAETGLVPGGLLRAQRAGVAAGLDLVAVEGERGRRVAGRELGVELAVPILERRLVAEVADREEIDLLPRVGAPDPEAVLEDRAADLGAIFLIVVDAVPLLEGGLGVVAVPGARLAEVGAVDVEVPLGVLVVDVVAAGAAPLVGTLFG